VVAYDPREPLSLCTLELESPASAPHARALRFEFTSAGDRVAGRLLVPRGGKGPVPLVLVGHDSGAAKDASDIDTTCASWAREAAVASIDLPLHGERRSVKLSERILRSLDLARGQSAFDAELWTTFAAQAAADLRRALDALGERPELDASRTGYLGLGLGSILGAAFCAADPRVHAAALVNGGGGFGPAAADPARHLGDFAPRPLLLLNASRDQTIPRTAAEALHAAAGQPSEVVWLDCGHAELPAAAMEPIGRFFRAQLAAAA